MLVLRLGENLFYTFALCFQITNDMDFPFPKHITSTRNKKFCLLDLHKVPARSFAMKRIINQEVVFELMFEWDLRKARQTLPENCAKWVNAILFKNQIFPSLREISSWKKIHSIYVISLSGMKALSCLFKASLSTLFDFKICVYLFR